MRTGFIGVAASSGGLPGAPGAIRNLVATAADGGANLAWTAPVSNGGSAITDHEIEVSSDSGATWTGLVQSGSSSASYSYTGLANSTNYLFKVRAINAVGAGPYVQTTSAVSFFPTVSGGTLTSDATYYYRTFNSNGSLAIGNTSISLDYFVIAGGGAGSAGSTFFDGFDTWTNLSGGGGAAGTRDFSSASFSVGSHSIVIGGAGSGSSIGSVVSVTAGGNGNGAAGSGGSNALFSGAAASYPSGGGGAGANGNGSGTNGGAAVTAVGSNYGLGGSTPTGFVGFSPSSIPGISGGVNTGNGGGGARGNAGGGSGGSGRVVVRYLKSAVGD